MSSTPITTVTVAGGTGGLGFHIVDALLSDGSFKVKVLRRLPKTANEKAELLASKGAEIIYADYNQHDDLVKALSGTDALISAASPAVAKHESDFDALQMPLLNAAKAAGVRRFIPSEWGVETKPGDHPLTDTKAAFREKVEQSGLEYTRIACGLFAEYLGWCGFDVKNKTAKFYVDPDTTVAVTCMSDIGKYAAESLKLEACRNASIKVAGSRYSLKEILKLFEEATGSKWKFTVDEGVRHRYANQIDPIPSPIEVFIATLSASASFENIDNDKFSFSPRPLVDDIAVLVQQASV
ncbi:10495_t:CDS:2 [Paraglomus occultum]|uniref:10495_t:CDS:1 n=1 Tax=Paraglomus occultum TaxID=144539 RepID=A0A9N9AMA1_9GLOM|nr:10495_t:CDS:2 [Paraglomus occultum]